MAPATRINRIDAIQRIATLRLRELREKGMTHTEIASMFDLTPARVQQLCTELWGENSGGHEYRIV